MAEIYYRLHLFLFYLGMILIFAAVVIEQYWMGLFVTGFVLSLLGMLYYWVRIL